MDIFERAGCRNYSDELRRIAELSDSEADDSSGSGEEQPKTYPTPRKGPVFSRDQLPSAAPKTAEVYVKVKEENLPEGITELEVMIS